MDETARKMAEVNWVYADKDPHALAILEQRIQDTGKQLQLITYSDLVKGVEFHLPNIRKGEAYQISIYDWSGLDRAILGEFLGYISMRSYKEASFMASALVVSRSEYKPSDLHPLSAGIGHTSTKEAHTPPQASRHCCP